MLIVFLKRDGIVLFDIKIFNVVCVILFGDVILCWSVVVFLFDVFMSVFVFLMVLCVRCIVKLGFRLCVILVVVMIFVSRNV